MIEKDFWHIVEKQLKYVLYGDSIHKNDKIIFKYENEINALTLNDLWDFLISKKFNPITIKKKEYIINELKNKLSILSYNPSKSIVEFTNPLYIMRHRYKGNLIKLTTDNGEITVTKNHSLIKILSDGSIEKISPIDTKFIWYVDLDYEIFSLKINEKNDINYDDWVYDLEVPDTHNFIINGFLVHNTDSLFVHLPSLNSENIEESINKSAEIATNINNLITNYLNTTLLPKLNVQPIHNYTEFKNEFTCNAIMFLDVKKNYAYSMTSKEGRIFNPASIEYTGIPIVRTNVNEFSKELLRDLIEKIILNKNISKQNVMQELNKLAQEKNDYLAEQIKNGNFKYFATPAKWSDGDYIKDPSTVIGMRLYNTLMGKEIFKPLSSSLQIPIDISNFEKIKSLDFTMKYGLNSEQLNILNYICLPYNYNSEEVFELFKKFNISITNNLWAKLTEATTIQKVVELIKDYAKK